MLLAQSVPRTQLLPSLPLEHCRFTQRPETQSPGLAQVEPSPPELQAPAVQRPLRQSVGAAHGSSSAPALHTLATQKPVAQSVPRPQGAPVLPVEGRQVPPAQTTVLIDGPGPQPSAVVHDAPGLDRHTWASALQRYERQCRSSVQLSPSRRAWSA